MAKMPAVVQEGRVRQHELNDGETFEYGAAVLLDSDEEITEAGADPAEILGFALKAAEDDVPFSDLVLVALAEEDARFELDGDSDPTADDINQEYGVAVDGDGIWHVDTTDTSNTVVYVVDVDTDRNRFLVRILEGSRQISA